MGNKSQTIEWFSFWVVIDVLKRRCRLVLLGLFAGLCLSVLASYMVAPKYMATTRIMPPQMQNSAIAGVSGQLGGLSVAAMGIPGLKNPNDLYIGILESQSVASGLIAGFDLRNKFSTDSEVATTNMLSSIVDINSGKDGLINISVEWTDPSFAAAVANGYVIQLKKVMANLAVTDASRRRLFFEGQLRDIKEKLAAAELSFKKTQEKSGLIQAEGQVYNIISSISQMRSAISVREAELESIKAYATSNNPDYIRLSREIEKLREQLRQYEAKNVDDTKGVAISSGSMPGAGLEYARGLREVKYQEAMLEMISKQYELAKIDEARDSSVIQVLDFATPPDKKSKPKRALIVAFGCIFGCFLGLMLAFVYEYYYLNLAKRQKFIAVWHGK